MADNINVVLPPNYVAVPAASSDVVNVRQIINLTGEETVANIARASIRYKTHTKPKRTIASPLVAFSNQDAKRKRDEELLQPDEDDEWEQAISKSVKPTEATITHALSKNSRLTRTSNQKAVNEKIDRIIAHGGRVFAAYSCRPR